MIRRASHKDDKRCQGDNSSLSEAILSAAARTGTPSKDPEADLLGFFEWLARRHPRMFLGLLAQGLLDDCVRFGRTKPK